MENIIINDLYDRISRILKNDQQYSYRKMSALITACTDSLQNPERYFTNYPPLVDILELGAGLEYNDSAYQKDIVKQIQYKLTELRQLLPEIR